MLWFFSVRLLLPGINCTAPEGGLSWGPSGLEITKGYSFSITCSTQPQYPGGVFHLSFSGSKSTMTQPATNHSASFYFPAADYSHQGNYSCVYQVDLSPCHFYSTETEKLMVTIRGTANNKHGNMNFTFTHLADAFIQSDVQGRDNQATSSRDLV